MFKIVMNFIHNIMIWSTTSLAITVINTGATAIAAPWVFSLSNKLYTGQYSNAYNMAITGNVSGVGFSGTTIASWEALAANGGEPVMMRMSE